MRTTLDVGALPKRLYQQLTTNNLTLDGVQPTLRFHRAHRGIRYEQAHYVIAATIDGERRYLRGNSRYHDVVPAADLAGNLLIDHRPDRLADRNRKRRAYYKLRDELGVELITQS
jgi:hypothetical protein